MGLEEGAVVEDVVAPPKSHVPVFALYPQLL